MKSFTIYDSKTGLVIRRGHCRDIDFDHQPNEGESVIEGTAKDTEMVDVTSSAFIEKPDTVWMLEAEAHNRKFDIRKENQKLIAKKNELVERMARAELEQTRYKDGRPYKD